MSIRRQMFWMIEQPSHIRIGLNEKLITEIKDALNVLYPFLLCGDARVNLTISEVWQM